jgi:hypothetical protein
MSNATSQLKLRIAVLRILSEIDLLLMPEPDLLGQCRIEVVPPPTVVEFSEALRFLESNGLIISARGSLGGPIKWKITEAGKATLAENS